MGSRGGQCDAGRHVAARAAVDDDSAGGALPRADEPFQLPAAAGPGEVAEVVVPLAREHLHAAAGLELGADGPEAFQLRAVVGDVRRQRPAVGDATAAVLYLAIQIETQLGMEREATDYMNQLLRDFPDSPEARQTLTTRNQ